MSATCRWQNSWLAKNGGLSYCKLVEVIAETTAPLTAMGELLTRIPSQRAEEPVRVVGSDPEPSPSIVSETLQLPWRKDLNLLYMLYADFKPPTSPSPNATISCSMDCVPKVAPVSGNSKPQPEPVDKSEEKQQPPKLKSRPLSPYTIILH
ncbi:hypothetical protein RJ641_013735 [Dillenia turbinata]|uniref:Uncharacterized protein n=1 Tax=Dillenia turbinata TaxID=194707 RepID=A0AAN8WCM0_9MAGN